jgi:hypothetical protein
MQDLHSISSESIECQTFDTQHARLCYVNNETYMNNYVKLQ